MGKFRLFFSPKSQKLDLPENGKTRFFPQKLDFEMTKTRFFNNFGRVWLPNTGKWKQKLPFFWSVINTLGKEWKNLILHGEIPIKMTTFSQNLDWKFKKLDLKTQKLDLNMQKLDFPAFWSSGLEWNRGEKKACFGSYLDPLVKSKNPKMHKMRIFLPFEQNS